MKEPFGGQKSRFLDFFKFVLVLFRKCLGIVFSLKRPTFSPLGPREALKNVDKASPGVFIVWVGLGVVGVWGVFTSKNF